MREDKLIRFGAAGGLESEILIQAKRACASGKVDVLEAIVEHVTGISKVAAGSTDKALKARCNKLAHDLRRVIDLPDALVIETKGAATARQWEPDFDEKEVAADASLGEITGYGAVFNNVDYGGDKILPGAFRRSLADWERSGRLPIMLAQHDSGVFPVGVWTRMTEDAHGLRVAGKVADTPRGREAWTLVHMTPSALSGLSIGFSIAKSDFDRGGVRLLQEIDLFEISIVGLPMNTLARIDLKRTAEADKVSQAIAHAKRALEQANAKNTARANGTLVDFPNSRASGSDDPRLIVAAQRLADTVRRAS